MCFAKDVGKNESGKYSQNLLDSATHATKVVKASKTDAINTALKREIKKKTAEATGDLVGNKTDNKINSVSKELYSKKSLQNSLDKTNNEIELPKERYVSPEKRQQIIDDLRLV